MRVGKKVLDCNAMEHEFIIYLCFFVVFFSCCVCMLILKIYFLCHEIENFLDVNSTIKKNINILGCNLC